jgi:hypothetical protein
MCGQPDQGTIGSTLIVPSGKWLDLLAGGPALSDSPTARIHPPTFLRCFLLHILGRTFKIFCGMKKVKRVQMTENVKKFFQQTGALGGESRARNHTPAELSAWGRMGGRPKKGKKTKGEK